jgi:hypothetical protein
VNTYTEMIKENVRFQVYNNGVFVISIMNFNIINNIFYENVRWIIHRNIFQSVYLRSRKNFKSFKYNSLKQYKDNL